MPIQAITLPECLPLTRASPHVTAPVMMKLSAPPTEKQCRDGRRRPVDESERPEIHQPRKRGSRQADDNCTFAPARVGIGSRPHAREHRGDELAPCHESDYERAEAEPAVKVERQYGSASPMSRKPANTAAMIGSNVAVTLF